MTTRSPRSASPPTSRFSTSRLALTALVLAAASGMALTATTSETAIRKSFVAALETAPSTNKAAPHAGTEEYWLSALRPDGPAPVTKTVAVGDRIVMTLSGVERTFEVASVAEFSPEITAVDTASAPTRFVLVTAKDAKNGAAKPIRFVMEIEGAAATVATRGANRAL